MSVYKTIALLAIATSITACATNKIDSDDALDYREAIKADAKKPLPVPVTKTRVVPTPGQLKPFPDEKEPEKHGHTHRPGRVIEKANHKARQAPDDHGYYNSIMTYDYDAGALYRVYAAPLQLTDIMLQPGERMTSKPAAADTTRWKVAASMSVESGVEQQHLLITPKRPSIYTSLVIATNLRTYHLELISYHRTYMAAVNWNYPQDSIDSYELEYSNTERTNGQVDAAQISLKDANFAYDIKVVDGKPDWTPVRVLDNGKKTFIQFPDALAVSDAPSLYVKKYGQQQIVNYRPNGKYYIVDGVFPRYELRVGSKKDMDVVEIVNEGAARPERGKRRTKNKPGQQANR